MGNAYVPKPSHIRIEYHCSVCGDWFTQATTVHGNIRDMHTPQKNLTKHGEPKQRIRFVYNVAYQRWSAITVNAKAAQALIRAGIRFISY